MSIKKNYPPKGEKCRVTFKLSKEMAQGAEAVFLAGDFNDWDAAKEPMRALKDGSFSTTITLEKGHTYQFRYYLGNGHWANESEADHQASTPFSDAKNSVIVV